MAEVSCVLLNVLCPDLARLFQVFVPQHASTVDIAIAVAQLTGSHLDMWLVRLFLQSVSLIMLMCVH